MCKIGKFSPNLIVSIAEFNKGPHYFFGLSLWGRKDWPLETTDLALTSQEHTCDRSSGPGHGDTTPAISILHVSGTHLINQRMDIVEQTMRNNGIPKTTFGSVSELSTYI